MKTKDGKKITAVELGIVPPSFVKRFTEAQIWEINFQVTKAFVKKHGRLPDV